MKSLIKTDIKVFDPITAFRLIKTHSIMPFDETIDLYIKLGTNAKRTEFNMRGSCYMPIGLGTQEKVCFVPFDENEEKLAKEAGINLMCDENMMEKIGKGIIEFDKLYATENGVKLLKPFARILGPKGLFPNKKV